MILANRLPIKPVTSIWPLDWQVTGSMGQYIVQSANLFILAVIEQATPLFDRRCNAWYLRYTMSLYILLPLPIVVSMPLFLSLPEFALPHWPARSSLEGHIHHYYYYQDNQHRGHLSGQYLTSWRFATSTPCCSNKFYHDCCCYQCHGKQGCVAYCYWIHGIRWIRVIVAALMPQQTGHVCHWCQVHSHWCQLLLMTIIHSQCSQLYW